MERNKYREYLFLPIASLGLLSISFLGFSKKTRQEIYDRDGGKSSLSGKTGRLHAAHINHDKKSDRYADSSNGRMLTPQEHYEDHYYRHGRNGLPKNHNIGALRMLWQSMSEYEREGLPDYHNLLKK